MSVDNATWLWHKDRDVVTQSYAGLLGMMMAIS
jgi:hypothetical protein